MFLFSKDDDFKDPIDIKPLRRAGQSLEDKIFLGLFIDKALCFFMILLFVGGIIFGGLILRFVSTSTLTFIIIGLLILMFYLLKRMKNFLDEMDKFRRGLRGERFVGDLLDELKEQGCKVLHDCVLNDNGNIDHVVIARTGVFAIETKTMRKRKKKAKESDLSYDGKGNIKYVNSGLDIPIQPFAQAKAESKSLKNFIEAKTGKACWVQPVIVFPGIYVSPGTERSNKKDHDVWVCNPKIVESLICDEPYLRLSQQEVNAIYAVLADHNRNYVSPERR